jgi:tetratricopeptide (TPR) repeat protein
VERALRIAIDANSPIASVVMNNLAVLSTWRGELVRSGQLYAEAVELANRFGDSDGARFMRGNVVNSLFFLGRWEESLAAADTFVAECETTPHYMEGGVRNVRAYLRAARGDFDGALEDARVSLAQAREIKDPQRLIPSLLNAARIHGLVGRDEEALGFATEAIAVARPLPSLAGTLGQLSLVIERLGLRDEVLEVLEGAPRNPWVDAATAAARGDYVRTSEIFHGSGARGLEAEARLLSGEALMAEGRPHEALPHLEAALGFYRDVGASYFARRAEALLPASA